MRWLKSAALPSLTLAMLPLPSTPCAPQDGSFVHQKRYTMGTVFEIVIYNEDLPRADAAARAALDEVVRLDGILSNYKPESDLSQMNRTAHFQPVRIPRELYESIEESLFYSRHSDGQFDISAYIDAGGSTIYALGAAPGGNAWPVRLRDPSGKLGPEVMLINNSVSTSEQSAPSSLQGDAPGHIILPGTGKPLQTRYAISVTAPSATASDALSTTLLLLGPTKGAALVKTLHNVSAIWIDSDGQRTLAGDGASFLLTGESRPIQVAPPKNRMTATSKVAEELLP